MITSAILTFALANAHYAARPKVSCQGNLGSSEITITVDGSQAKLTRRDHDQDWDVTFEGVDGVADAYDTNVYTAKGFALQVGVGELAGGSYLGAVGVGAWGVNDLRRVSFAHCEFGN